MSLRDDERAQAIQIGAVLFFAIVIILFAIYQAFIVPTQNRKVEFNHNERVQGDMVELRNALLEAKASGEDTYASVELGTEFPPRLLAINPGPPSGSLRGTSLRPIVIEEIGGGEITDQVCPGNDHRTRFVEYSPSYVEYREPDTIRYEHSLLYHEFRDGLVRMTNQQIVQGDTVQIIPIRGDLDESGSHTAAVDPIPGRLDTSQREDITVKLPTELSEGQWESALDGQVDPQNVTVTNGAAGDNVTLTLSGERRIECGPVGLGETPPSGGRGGAIDEINPAAPGDIRLVEELRDGNNITLRFNNTAGTNNFTEGRINFYEGGASGDPNYANIRRVGEQISAQLFVPGDYKPFNPKITLDGNGAITDVRLEFDSNVKPGDWFVITLELETGEQGLYFVRIPS